MLPVAHPGLTRLFAGSYRLWPNLAFDVYPGQVDFMQFVPVSSTTTLIREIGYVRPEMGLAAFARCLPRAAD